jgi:hypothetical protein
MISLAVDLAGEPPMISPASDIAGRPGVSDASGRQRQGYTIQCHGWFQSLIQRNRLETLFRASLLIHTYFMAVSNVPRNTPPHRKVGDFRPHGIRMKESAHSDARIVKNHPGFT